MWNIEEANSHVLGSQKLIFWDLKTPGNLAACLVRKTVNLTGANTACYGDYLIALFLTFSFAFLIKIIMLVVVNMLTSLPYFFPPFPTLDTNSIAKEEVSRLSTVSK